MSDGSSKQGNDETPFSLGFDDCGIFFEDLGDACHELFRDGVEDRRGQGSEYVESDVQLVSELGLPSASVSHGSLTVSDTIKHSLSRPTTALSIKSTLNDWAELSNDEMYSKMIGLSISDDVIKHMGDVPSLSNMLLSPTSQADHHLEVEDTRGIIRQLTLEPFSLRNSLPGLDRDVKLMCSSSLG